MFKFICKWFSPVLFSELFVTGCAAQDMPSSHRLACDPSSGVNASDFLEVDAARLYLLVRGEECDAPILLWLHGGPGAAERPLFRLYNRDLEQEFIVAYWDQRGAGNSWNPDANPDTLTVPRHLQDLDRVVEYLRIAFPDRPILLVGHSWGAGLAIHYAAEHPQALAGVVAVNPLIDGTASQIAQTAFVSAEAERRSDADALDWLGRIGQPPFDGTELLEMQRLVGRYGGEFHNRPSFLGATISGLLRGYVGASEISRIIKANNATLNAMADDVAAFNLRESVSALDVPLLVLLGRHDRILAPAIAIDFLERLDARRKQIMWFEGSAHNIPFEEPEIFNRIVWEFSASVSENAE